MKLYLVYYCNKKVQILLNTLISNTTYKYKMNYVEYSKIQ